MVWLLAQPRWQRSVQGGLVALAAIGLLFSLEHLSTPLPLNNFTIPAIYQRLAAEPGDFAILELPTGWRNGARVMGKSDVLIMMQQWYQTAHGKPRLGGNTSRNPAYKFQYFSETPLLAEIIALMNADRSHLAPILAAQYPAIAERARQDAPALFAWLGIRYVTLHVEKSPPLLVQLVEEALPVTFVEEWQGPDWAGAPSTIRLYAVNPTPLSGVTINLADANAQMLLAEGWSPLGMEGVSRFAQRSFVELLLPHEPSGLELALHFAQPTTVTYTYQGKPLGQQSGDQHTLTLPAPSERVASSRLGLRFDDTPRAISELVTTPTPVAATGYSLEPGVAILAQSAGEEVGDFAHIWVNGIDHAKNERGYNLVALTAAGEVIESAVFDTMVAGESERLVEWLGRWRVGTIVVGAGADTVADEAGTAFNAAAVEALARLGVSGDLRGKLRWSHAFVGVVGAPPGSALENLQITHPASVWLGVPLAAPVGYGPLQRVVISTR